MSIFRYVISLLALMAVATFAMGYLLASCSLPAVTARYEVIASVRVGGDVVQGSAVWEATIKDGPEIFFQTGPTNDVAGEAIRVDTPIGDPIFVLRRPAFPPEDYAGNASHPYGAFIRLCVEPDAGDPEFIDAIAQFDGSCSVSPTPVLVRFEDLTDPASVEVLRYGPGLPVELVDVTIKATKAPVTNQISQSLPWLQGMVEGTNLRTGSPDSPMPSGGSVIEAGEFYAIDFKKGHGY